MKNGRIVGFGLIVIGLVLLFFGLEANDSFSSGFSKAFQGAPSDKAIWLMVGGGIVTLLGVVKTMRSGPKGA